MSRTSTDTAYRPGPASPAGALASRRAQVVEDR